LNDADPTPSTIVTAGGVFSMPASSSINTSTGLISLSSIGVGTFQVIYTISTPCLASDTFQIIINPLPDVTVTGTLYACENTPAFDLTANLNPPTTGGTWSGAGVSGTTFDPVSVGAGTYGPVYTATDGNGCTNSDSVTIVLNAIPVISFTGVASAYCQSDPPFTPVGSPPGGDWVIDAVNVGPVTSVDPSTFSAGFHSIAYQYLDLTTGCSATTTPSGFTISSMPLDPVITSPLNQTICSGGTVTLTATNPNTGNGSIIWFADLGLTNQIGIGPSYITPSLTSSTVVYMAIVNAGCNTSINVFNITVNNAQVTAGPDLTICPGTAAQLNVTSLGGTISWSPGGSLNDSTLQNPLATPNINTTYVVTVTNGPCFATDSVNVTIDGSNPNCGIIPSYNAFSPDRDGVNDTWIIDAVSAHPDNRVTIFNRWGDKLVSFEDYDNVNVVWDGTYNGNLLPSGTYFYVLEYLDINMQVSGWVQLTR
jgi:gliding motility-associated-like protein